VFCTTQWMQRRTTSHLNNRMREDFWWGSGGWEAEACTPPEVLPRHLWELCSTSCLSVAALDGACCSYQDSVESFAVSESARHQQLMLFSCLFCLQGRVSVYLCFISIRCILYLFGCMSLGFIARGNGLARSSVGDRTALLALLADLDWYVFVGFLLGRGCWVEVIM